MKKDDVVEKMAEAAGITKAAAETALKAALDGILGGLKNGERVVLVGFGSFNATQRAARQGVHPQTKQPIAIPARKSVKFKPSKELVEALQ
ncbi:HU family DNA-binding protein [bacterium]|nr:HU family DNA-binding protein [bacterium]